MTYQAIYDAVRSKISNSDVGSAVESAIQNLSLGHYVQQAMYEWQMAGCEQQRPFVLLKPKVFIDNDNENWCVLYGENLVSGIAGYGKSPHLASLDFDKNYYAKLPVEASISGKEGIK